MSTFEPIVTTLDQVQVGDTYIFGTGDGTWTSPKTCNGFFVGGESYRAVILDRPAPWPNAPLIRVLSGTADGAQIRPGTLAIRGVDAGEYVLPTGTLACEGYKGDSITEWEALTPVPREALRTLLDAVRGMRLDPDEETLLKLAWSVLDEAEREARS